MLAEVRCHGVEWYGVMLGTLHHHTTLVCPAVPLGGVENEAWARQWARRAQREWLDRVDGSCG